MGKTEIIKPEVSEQEVLDRMEALKIPLKTTLDDF